MFFTSQFHFGFALKNGALLIMMNA